MPAVATVLYPKTAESTFDLEYYLKTHMPLAEKTWTPHGLTGYQVIQLDGSAGYSIQCLLFADSIESFQTALGKYATEVLADVPNFSNVKPIILVGGVVGGSQA